MNRKIFLMGGLICFCCGVFGQTQMITNGGFEATIFAPWDFQGAGATVGSDPLNAHSGSRYATMGSQPLANQTITQDFFVPTNTAAAVLSYFWAVVSSDTTGLDQLQVLIVNSNHTSILATVDTESN